MADKTYLNAFTIKEKEFDNGGSLINVSINIEKFREEIKGKISETGYLNFTIGKRREIGKYGDTHFAYWKPYEKPESREYASPDRILEDDSDMPFKNLNSR